LRADSYKISALGQALPVSGNSFGHTLLIHGEIIQPEINHRTMQYHKPIAQNQHIKNKTVENMGKGKIFPNAVVL